MTNEGGTVNVDAAQQMLREQIDQRREHVASLVATRDQVAEQIRNLEAEHEELGRRLAEMDETVQALERALAVLVEHAPEAAQPVSELPRRVREGLSLPELDEALRSKRPFTEYERGEGQHRRETQRYSAAEIVPRSYDPATRTRIEVVDGILALLEDYGPRSQQELGEELTELLGWKLQTVRGMVSAACIILNERHQIRPTGERKGRSRIWELAPPPERASAGLGLDDDAQPVTSPPPSLKTVRGVREEPVNFEGSRRRH